MNIHDAQIEARARRIILAAVHRDSDAVNNILDEQLCLGCMRELARTLGWLAGGILVAAHGRAEADQLRPSMRQLGSTPPPTPTTNPPDPQEDVPPRPAGRKGETPR